MIIRIRDRGGLGIPFALVWQFAQVRVLFARRRSAAAKSASGPEPSTRTSGPVCLLGCHGHRPLEPRKEDQGNGAACLVPKMDRGLDLRTSQSTGLAFGFSVAAQ